MENQTRKQLIIFTILIAVFIPLPNYAYRLYSCDTCFFPPSPSGWTRVLPGAVVIFYLPLAFLLGGHVPLLSVLPAFLLLYLLTKLLKARSYYFIILLVLFIVIPPLVSYIGIKKQITGLNGEDYGSFSRLLQRDRIILLLGEIYGQPLLMASVPVVSHYSYNTENYPTGNYRAIFKMVIYLAYSMFIISLAGKMAKLNQNQLFPSLSVVILFAAIALVSLLFFGAVFLNI